MPLPTMSRTASGPSWQPADFQTVEATGCFGLPNSLFCAAKQAASPCRTPHPITSPKPYPQARKAHSPCPTTVSDKKKEAATRASFLVKQMQNDLNAYSYLYSAQLFMSMSSSFTRQNAWMKALAKRLLVMSGTLRSIAARRIL